MNWIEKQKVKPWVLCGKCDGIQEEAGYDPVHAKEEWIIVGS